MILADTSVWVDHLRLGSSGLARLASEADMLMHPFILGELSLGSLPQRTSTLNALGDMISAVVADDREVALLIERERLYGSGKFTLGNRSGWQLLFQTGFRRETMA